MLNRIRDCLKMMWCHVVSGALIGQADHVHGVATSLPSAVLLLDPFTSIIVSLKSLTARRACLI
jgi:hypothetical protein